MWGRPTGDGAHVKHTPTRRELYGQTYKMSTVVWKPVHSRLQTWRGRLRLQIIEMRLKRGVV
jgi:hypothetical protein